MIYKKIIFSAICILLLYLIFFHGLGKIALFDKDEPRYAESAREMVELRSPFIPYFNYEYRLNKPVFYYWSIIAGYTLFGINEFGARFSSALAGFLLVIATYLFIKRFRDGETALLSAAVLAVFPYFVAIARSSVTDCTLTFFESVSLMLFFGYYISEKENKKRESRIYCLGASVFLAIAFLTKGPPGLFPPIIIVCIFLIVQKSLRFLFNKNIALGIFIFLLISLPWFIIAGSFLGFKEAIALIHTETIGRYKEGFAHPQPFFYFALVTIGLFLPWSVFFFVFLYKKITDVLRDRTIDDLSLYLLIWFITIFIFFSFSSSKLATYILPLSVPFAAIIGEHLHLFIRDEKRKDIYKIVKGIFIFLGVFLLVISAAGLIVITKEKFPRENVQIDTAYALIITAGISIISYILVRNNKRKESIISFIYGMFILIFWIYNALLPSVQKDFTCKFLIEDAQKLMNKGEKLYIYNTTLSSIVYYTKGDFIALDSTEKVRELFRKNRPVFILLRQSKYGKLKKGLGETFQTYIVSQNKESLVITNIPLPLREKK